MFADRQIIYHRPGKFLSLFKHQVQTGGTMKTRFWVVAVIMAALFAAACGGKSDADLKTAAEAALKADPSTSAVAVEVADGVATLSGIVADEATKTKAGDTAKVEGIKSVTNNVEVAQAPPAASADDPTMKTKVEEALKAKNCGSIDVEVKEGVVTLRGSIEQAKLAQCIMVVQETKPKKVDNQMKVEK
jgi:osmotically-inducible protein OsmY